MRTPAVLITLLVALLVTSACGEDAQPADRTPQDTAVDRLAFSTSGYERPGDIFVVNADGSAPANLTSSPSDDKCCPVWSPDGTRIAFVSNRDGNDEVYVIGADGSGFTNLTNNPAPDNKPAWSPDGTHIAFVSGRDARILPSETPTSLADLWTKGDYGWEQVYVMNADGSDQARLTENRSSPAGDSFPVWSPDGTSMAFISTRGGSPDVYVSDVYLMNADGSGQTPLTDGREASMPTWSPDGTRLAFVSGFATGAAQVYVMNADGSGAVQLGDGSSPAWSPDGTHIAFVRGREVGMGGGTSDIYVMDADGSQEGRLTEGEFMAGDSFPAWSPDGTRIAFVRGSAIYVMNADGSNQTRLAEGPALLVVWSPAP